MRISDWSSDVCSSDLQQYPARSSLRTLVMQHKMEARSNPSVHRRRAGERRSSGAARLEACPRCLGSRSEEHTSELQSLMRISYAVFCLKKNIQQLTIYSAQHQSVDQDTTNRQVTTYSTITLH